MTRRLKGKDYYYAGGERVELVRDDALLAFDGESLHESSLDEHVRTLVVSASRPVSSGIRIVDRAALPASAVQQLEKAGVLQPVFRCQGAILIVLPEVRVEESRAGGPQRKLVEWLEGHTNEVSVESDEDGRTTLRPRSGSGGDALQIANALAEKVEPELAQARFLRIVPRPMR